MNATTGRRAFLASVGATLLGPSAGCLGGGSGGGSITTAAERLPAPTLDADDAPVTVAVYKDYACPHCATFAAQAEPRIRSEYVESGVVALEHHDFPIPVARPASYRAASAAREVQAQAGDEAFFAYADRLFEHQSDLGLDAYADQADSLAASVDGEAVRRAARGRVHEPTVSADREAGSGRGVQGTPTVFVGDSKLDEWSWETFTAAVDAAREAGGTAAETPDGSATATDDGTETMWG
jgi:protein-disulfide isomerase